MSLTSERLRQARQKKGLKQTQVKEKTGIHNKTLSGYENNVAEPDLKTLKTLAELYEVSVEWLIGTTNGPTSRITDEEQEVTEKLENKIPIDEIAEQHEFTFQGQLLNQEEKERVLEFVEALLIMRNKHRNKKKQL